MTKKARRSQTDENRLEIIAIDHGCVKYKNS